MPHLPLLHAWVKWLGAWTSRCFVSWQVARALVWIVALVYSGGRNQLTNHKPMT
jgi:hypothetical protein